VLQAYGKVADLIEDVVEKLLAAVGGGSSGSASTYADQMLRVIEEALVTFEAFVATGCAEDEQLLQHVQVLQFELEMATESLDEVATDSSGSEEEDFSDV
jgi:hypothetical protein